MDSANVNGNTTSYVYNAFNELVAKNNSTVNKNFIYDNNQIIGEYEGTDNIEYIYLGKTPIALYKNGQLFFIHTDYLETPRAITNNSQAVVWKWDNIDPFGKNLPTNLGIDFNLRFMGQYSDIETGLFYNYYRYYNPTTGRYIQPDPIGLNGGFDLYAYVGQNPVNGVDLLGLKTDFTFVKQFYSLLDHAALRIDGMVYSIYPTSAPIGGMYSHADIAIDSLANFKKKYNLKNKYFLTVSLNLNIEQEKKLKNYFYSLLKQNAIKNNIYYYSLFGNQCATTIDNALNSVGLQNEIFDNNILKTPNQLFQRLITKGIQNGPYFPEDYQ